MFGESRGRARDNGGGVDEDGEYRQRKGDVAEDIRGPCTREHWKRVEH